LQRSGRFMLTAIYYMLKMVPNTRTNDGVCLLRRRGWKTGHATPANPSLNAPLWFLTRRDVARSQDRLPIGRWRGHNRVIHFLG
jgi:hypothetical protein